MKLPSILLLALLILLGSTPAAWSDDPPVSINENAEVVVVARDPGSPGSKSHRKPSISTGPTHCIAYDTITIPCTTHRGTWSHTHHCYIITRNSTGGWCTDLPIATPGTILFPRRIPPTQTEAELPDPGQLAHTAVEHMHLQPITIATSPKTVEQDPNALAYVHWNTWLWNSNTDPASTGPITQTATAGTYTVTATATINKIVWDMGDGGSVTCTTTTPWNTRYTHNEPSPTCGYLYTKDGEYLITATTHWTITWHAPTAHGTLTATTTNTAHLHVAEAHMLNTPIKKK
ncbi:MAG: hypothetical protein Q4D96_07670 [Propionibacteriaceae bacterium]|nr:hypothetical protein [Propionibacteriaceae bacterium]